MCNITFVEKIREELWKCMHRRSSFCLNLWRKQSEIFWTLNSLNSVKIRSNQRIMGEKIKRCYMSCAECRVFRSFFWPQSIYGSTLYIKAKSKIETSSRTNTFYRAQQLCETDVFLMVQHAECCEWTFHSENAGLKKGSVIFRNTLAVSHGRQEWRQSGVITSYF